ncbi:hypothetical protein LUZ63_007619 [Rhynchospora breviuscula]|uniref:Protein kinase domain-containing protein n=1 Tax=Rhynchospora breviuscula TaxID=2022672 RepID=A0A9Q0CS16_9POAL|nr:hypothetical protein LUZ63_007619 [Rhynchospora breviuscula]
MSTSLLLFFSSLLFSPLLTHSTNPSAINDDVLGLIVFKADIVDPYSKLSSWNEDDPSACNWDFIQCDPRSNRVTRLALSGLSLSGKLGRGLLQLESLQNLDLSKNNFSGPLNPDLLRLKDLESLDLSQNGFTGSIPDSYFEQCRSIRYINLASNMIFGEMPKNVGSCPTLAELDLSGNRLSGSLPSGIWALNALRNLDLSDNELIGDIPAGISRMFNLRSISLRGNKLTGKLPEDIGECLLLKSLDLTGNSISGELPVSLKKLSTCTFLSLRSNSFSGEVPTWVGEMKGLETLDLSWNKFSGEIPSSIGNLNSLKVLKLSGNGFTGSVPESISGCTNLQEVDFSWNSLTGNLPSWIFKLGLQRISFSDNVLSGAMPVPESVNPSVQVLDLSSNSLSGWIPAEISNLQGLQFLNLSWNSFSGSVPMSCGQLKLLEVLDFTGCGLNGTIPAEIKGAISLKELRLGQNSLTGEILTQIGNCSSLTFLDLSQNNLTGPIPAALSNLTNLSTVNLSQNKLSGSIPKQLSNLPRLLSFNVSHNLLSGDIPSGTFFDSIPSSSLSDNPGLCGALVKKSCPAVLPKPIVLNPNSSNPLVEPSPNNPTSFHHKRIILSISTLIAIAAAATIAIGVITVTVLNLRVRESGARSTAVLELSDGYLSQSPTTDMNSGKVVMFDGSDPEFIAGNHAVANKDCELGRGGFGSVYKATLIDGQPVAIKKLTVSSLVKSQEDFEREVKLLGKLKHRNLVAMRGYYWTPSLQLLIYDYISGGNLYKHLHESSETSALSWKERFDIILGIARSLAHLHRHGVIHYNLKSSNVLLDSSGEAKVGDYGLAKLLPMLDRYVLSSKIQSALGYMAPEFACRAVKITDKCDVYGFGILVLEILTGKRPVEYLEDDVVVLCDLVRTALDEGRVEECIDERLCGKFPIEEAVPVVKLGLVCISQVPSNRPDMGEVVNILELIRCPQDSPEGEIS